MRESGVRAGERGLHFAAGTDGKVALVDLDVGPLQPLALLNVPFQFYVVRDAERQVPLLERGRGGCLLAPDAEAALAVKRLAPLSLRFAVATTSELKQIAAPVGSLRSAAEATERPSSRPIMWIGR